jgi:hypothetical protein
MQLFLALLFLTLLFLALLVLNRLVKAIYLGALDLLIAV